MIERWVAIQTGRTLSVKNSGIDAKFPQFSQEHDKLTDEEGRTCKIYPVVQFGPLHSLINLRKLGGDILEIIYALKTTPESAETVHSLREQLDIWFDDVIESYIEKTPIVFRKLQYPYYMISLVLSRPSPKVPLPPLEFIHICFTDSSNLIDMLHFVLLNSEESYCTYGITQNTINAGVIYLYSSWKLHKEESLISNKMNKLFEILNLLNSRIHLNSRMLKYIKFIHILSNNVIKKNFESNTIDEVSTFVDDTFESLDELKDISKLFDYFTKDEGWLSYVFEDTVNYAG